MPRMLTPLPRGTVDETGHTYGRLRVIDYAGLLDGKASWNCVCECRGMTGHPGKTIARGDRLRNGSCVSCGCWRADPNIRQAARGKVSAKRRREIARMGGHAQKTNRI